MAAPTALQIMLDAVQDVPELVALIQAISASASSHKGEDPVEEGLDILVDVAPSLKVLYKAIRAQVAPPATTAS